MFTGLIEDIGRIVGIEFRAGNKVLAIKSRLARELKRGDSCAVEGVCLTVTETKGDIFKAEVSRATLQQTTLKDIRRGDFCNLERALASSGRLGGHFVLGHIDEIGRITRILKAGRNYIFEIRVSANNQLRAKGSIAVSGISLTIQTIKGNIFQVVVIPFTYENTTLRYKRRGGEVNIEFDLLGKYAMKELGIWGWGEGKSFLPTG